MVQRMSREEIRNWVLREPEAELLKSQEELNHVIDCLELLMDWYWDNLDNSYLGHFLRAVVQNDFSEACGRADATNSKVLTLYNKFLFNCIPADYKDKVKPICSDCKSRNTSPALFCHNCGTYMPLER